MGKIRNDSRVKRGCKNVVQFVGVFALVAFGDDALHPASFVDTEDCKMYEIGHRSSISRTSDDSFVQNAYFAARLCRIASRRTSLGKTSLRNVARAAEPSHPPFYTPPNRSRSTEPNKSIKRSTVVITATPAKYSAKLSQNSADN